jgi:RNA polymerase sigma-70 factor (ECF subfamily)
MSSKGEKGAMGQEPDLQIIDDIRRGDTRKYALLVDRYKDRGLALAMRIVGGKEESEELLQDAFLRAYRALSEFRGDAKFGTWFYRILYNLCMTRVSRRRNRVELFKPSGDDDLTRTPEDDESPDALEILEEQQLVELLTQEVERLPERFRTPLTLYYAQELQYEEISELMGLPVGTVKTNLFRAKVLLRKRMLTLLRKEVNEL